MKKKRQAKLIELITEKPIVTQDELQAELQMSGFDVTQATVSRDIKELRVVKILDSGGSYRYAVNNAAAIGNIGGRMPNYNDIFANSVISVSSAVNDIVIKCHSGMAQGACAALDMMNCENVLGTLAGDDTILVIAKSEKYAVELCESLKELI